MRCGRPSRSSADSIAAPMSFVWTWQFQMPSPPTTTIESPMSPQPLLELLDAGVGEVAQEHHLVALLADVELAVDPGRAPGNGLERGADGRPGRLVGHRQRLAVDDVQGGVEQQQEPGPAGVDDTGVLQHRQQVGRRGERARARRRGRPAGPPPRSPPSAAAPSAAAALSRTTVRIVPSIGFSTAW